MKVPCGRTGTGILIPTITTSRRQVQLRKWLCGGSPGAKVRADEWKLHTRLSLRGERANDRKASCFRRYGKCSGCALTGYVPPFFYKKSGEVCLTGDRYTLSSLVTGHWSLRLGIPASSTGMSEHDDKMVAHSGAILPVNRQTSADAIVVRPQESTGEGLNTGTERRSAHLQTEASES